MYPRLRVTHQQVGPADAGVKQIGHFGYFSRQAQAALWPRILAFLRDDRPSSGGGPPSVRPQKIGDLDQKRRGCGAVYQPVVKRKHYSDCAVPGRGAPRKNTELAGATRVGAASTMPNSPKREQDLHVARRLVALAKRDFHLLRTCTDEF